MSHNIMKIAICCAILIIVIAPICDAKQGYAIVANRQKAVGGLGHVGVAFQNLDGTWTAGAIENLGGMNSAIVLPGQKHPSGEPANDAWVLENRPLNEILNRFVIGEYNRIKVVSVDNANAEDASSVIRGFGDRGYNIFLLDHCLKGTNDVMKAYGTTNLPTIVDLDIIPNKYYDALQGTEYFLDTNAHAYKGLNGVQLQSLGYPSQNTRTQSSGNPSQGLEAGGMLSSISKWISAWGGLSPNLNSLLNTVGVVLVLLFGIILIWRNFWVFIVNGVLGLAVLYLSSMHLGIWVNINAMTLLICAIGGIPGAVLLIVLQYFYGISF